MPVEGLEEEDLAKEGLAEGSEEVVKGEVGGSAAAGREAAGGWKAGNAEESEAAAAEEVAGSSEATADMSRQTYTAPAAGGSAVADSGVVVVSEVAAMEATATVEATAAAAARQPSPRSPRRLQTRCPRAPLPGRRRRRTTSRLA